MEPIDVELDESEVELPTEPMLLNVGPSHPAMHGTVRCVMELSGESIQHVDVQVGYLHRGFEKMCERGTEKSHGSSTPRIRKRQTSRRLIPKKGFLHGLHGW